MQINIYDQISDNKLGTKETLEVLDNIIRAKKISLSYYQSMQVDKNNPY